MPPVTQERDCEICGYTLRGLPKTALSVCPECGSAFDAVRPVSRLRYLAWAAVAVCVLAVHGALSVGPHDKMGLPMSIGASIAMTLSMIGIVAFSVIAMLLSSRPREVTFRLLLGGAIGCIACTIGTCMGLLIWN